MGHLVNANALRVGWFSNWTDSWYSEYAYYSEFFFMIFRMRLFLVYFFSSKRIERSAYFYSHFEIIQKYNNVSVNIFLYDGAVEGLMDGLFVDHYVEVRRLNANPQKRKNIQSFEAWKMLIVLNWMHNFVIYRWPLDRLGVLLKAFNYFKTRPLRRFFSHSNFIVKGRGSGPRAIFFFLLFSNLKSVISRNFVKNDLITNTVLSRFIYIMAWGLWNYDLFSHFKLFLSFVFEILSRFNKITVNFFSITGTSINAKFLSRFLARKLKQNYSVKELLDPIKKELGYISFVTKYPLSNYFYSMNKLEFNKSQVLEYRKVLFKYLILFLFSLHTKYYFIYYKNSSTWLFFDIFIALSLISKNYNSLSSRFNFYLSKTFTKNRAGLGFLFFFGKNYLGKQFSTLFAGFSRIKLRRKLDFYSYIDNIFDDFYANFSVFATNPSFLYNMHFYSSNVFLSKLIANNYWEYNYNYLYSKINKRSLRSLSLGRYGHLIGFKLHCLGRFSRKERASSIWFRQTKVPLNTLSAIIDYGFFTVPLRNSSATVKIWLYCKPNFPNFYFKII